jgi:GntR family transcriptional repressor for pyruvate dehydrogenase complex
VREAIRTLERDGLLHVKKGAKGGLFVAQDYDRPINDSIANLLAGGGASLHDLFEIRRLIEPYAAARTAELANERALAALAELVGQAEAERELGRPVRAHNIEFHRRILHMSGNPILAVIGEAVLRLLTDRIQAVVSRATSEKALATHRLLIGALKRRQPRKAAALMTADIAATGKRLARLSPEDLLQLAREPRATHSHRSEDAKP